MNRTISIFASLVLVTSAACKGDDAGGGSSGKPAEGKAPTMTVDESTWEVKDLKETSQFTNISMKVPKDAKLEKNGNGGVDIRVNDFYLLTVSNTAISNIAEGIKGDKSLTVERTDRNKMAKIVHEEPNGFVYTTQMKDEANGTQYQPESHFVWYVEKEGAFWSIQSARPLDNFSVPGSAYSEEIAKKIFEIVKASAKPN
jgi:hypothetical protein